jgi:DegV family protein with EDD domain
LPSLKKIKFVTDSVADLPAHLIEKWDITVVPAVVTYGGNSYDDDGVQFVREDVYAALEGMDNLPTTAAMSSETSREGIEAAFNKGADHVIILTIPAKLSGVYNSMRIAMREFPEDRVTLIDSYQLSMGVGWQALIGAETAAQTGSVAQTVAAIKQVQKHQDTYALLSTLKYLRRSGRVSGLTASIGALLDLKIVLKVGDGELKSEAKVRTNKRAINTTLDLVRSHAPFDRMAIMHANDLDRAQMLLDRLKDVAPPEVEIGTICPAIGVHGGPGIIGVTTVSKGWKDALGIRNTG